MKSERICYIVRVVYFSGDVTRNQIGKSFVSIVLISVMVQSNGTDI